MKEFLIEFSDLKKEEIEKLNPDELQKTYTRYQMIKSLVDLGLKFNNIKKWPLDKLEKKHQKMLLDDNVQMYKTRAGTTETSKTKKADIAQAQAISDNLFFDIMNS